MHCFIVFEFRQLTLEVTGRVGGDGISFVMITWLGIRKSILRIQILLQQSPTYFNEMFVGLDLTSVLYESKSSELYHNL